MAPKISEVAVACRLEQFFGRIDCHLKDRRKRESFAMYAFGILGDGERKVTVQVWTAGELRREARGSRRDRHPPQS